MSDITFNQYEALAYLVKYGNLYHLRQLELPAVTEEATKWWRTIDPDQPEKYFCLVNDEDVYWLLKEGYAETGHFDPNFARGKVIPTDAAVERFENHGLISESEGVGVHLGHCCRDHGCKYSREFCPVESKLFPPDSGGCAICYEDEQMDGAMVEGISDAVLIHELEARGYRVERPE